MSTTVCEAVPPLPVTLRVAVECACQPPRKLHMTPKQIEDGPVICGVCGTPFEAPEDSDQDKTEEN